MRKRSYQNNNAKLALSFEKSGRAYRKLQFGTARALLAPGQFIRFWISRSERIHTCFFSETHMGTAKAEIMKRRLVCDHFIINESDGRSGGLLMLWRKDIVIQCQSVSQYYTDVVVRGTEEWRLTGIYGEPRWENKHLMWEALRSLHGDLSLPWLVIGDSNEILYHYEKEGGRARSQSQLQAFQDSLRSASQRISGFLVMLLHGMEEELENGQTGCWRPKLAITEADRSDRLGQLVRPVWACNPSRVRVLCLESNCNPNWKGYVLPAYKYKGCGRLRVSNHNRTKIILFTQSLKP